MATANISQSSNSSEECSICLGSLTQQGLDIFTTACKHQFHFQCLVKNIQAKHNECPLCRTQLDSLADILNAGSKNNVQQIPIQTVIPPLPSPAPPPPPALSSTTEKTGLWNTLTRSLSSAFGWGNKPSRPPSGPNNSSRTLSLNIFAKDSSSEDQVDEAAVRALTERIKIIRQQSAANQQEVPLITLTTTLEFGAQESNKESNIYGMVSLKAPSLFSNITDEKVLDELHPPIDLICVVDQSGSMQGEKIALLKETLNYIIDQLTPLDRLAIISFNSSAFNRSNGLKLMTPEKKGEVRDAIRDNIRASGGTYIGSGLEMAIQIFKNRRTINPLGALLVLTDGEDNSHHDYSKLMNTLPAGVVCHTFGYGPDHRADLLSQIAEQGHGGTFTYIDETNAIGPSFATALGGLFTCIAKNLRIQVEFEQGYNITHAHTTYDYEPKKLPSRQITFKMIDLNADESRNLVFQLAIPKLKSSDNNDMNDQTIGQVSLEYTDANNGQKLQTPSVSFTLTRPNQIDPRSPLLQVNYALDVQRNRAETSEVLKQAVAVNDFNQANEILKAQLEKIRSSVSAQDPLCQQLIRDLECKYSSQQEFKTTMTNMYMQHGQERATYSTNKTISAACYTTSSQERYRKKLHS